MSNHLRRIIPLRLQNQKCMTIPLIIRVLRIRLRLTILSSNLRLREFYTPQMNPVFLVVVFQLWPVKDEITHLPAAKVLSAFSQVSGFQRGFDVLGGRWVGAGGAFEAFEANT